MDDVIKTYIERALELAERRDDTFSDADLADIARELGLSDEDLERVRQASEDHLSRGRGYLQHNMWDDAIRELEDASALAPSRNDIQLTLAEALTGRWEATDFPDDKIRAVALARGIVERDPDYRPAFDLLAKLTGAAPARATDGSTASDPQPARALIVALVMVMLTSITLGVFVGVSEDDTPPTDPTLVIPPTPALTFEDVPKFESGERELDVEFAASEGLEFTASRARLATYPERSFFTMWGDFEVIGDFEFEEIVVNVSLIDADGKVLKTHERDAWASHEARLRKGDHGVFTLLLDAVPEAESVKVAVARAEKVPATGPYADAEVITPKWLNDPPSNVGLEIRERHAGFSTGILKDKGFFKATWEFHNAGGTPVHELTYNVVLKDKKGAELETRKKIVTFSSHPPLGAGQTFLESATMMVPAAYAGYELVIIEFQ